MPNLFPENYESEVIEKEDTETAGSVGYRNGISFDDDAGDFRRDGKNKILSSNGIESWKSWCINCIETERYKYLAYDTDFGIETEEAMKAESKEEAESILIRQITEALMADPYERTEYIKEIVFDWTAPDAIAVDIAIQGKEDITIDITAYITKGEI